MEKRKKFGRHNALLIIMVAIFSAIGVRLYYLQVYNGEYYKDKANANAHKGIAIGAPRGLITDKNGIKLAKELPGYNITYTDTSNTTKDDTAVFKTLQKVFKILDTNGEAKVDSFPLKSRPYRFEFNSGDTKGIQTMQLRFLKDRGIQDNILKAKFNSKKEEELTSYETSELNNELLKLTPEQVYNQLLKEYGVIKGVSSLHIQETPDLIRRYLIVKDGIKMNSFSEYKSINIATNIKKNTSLVFEQTLSDMPGIKVENQPMRQYPYGQLGSSVLGYISKINSNDQAKYSAKGYDTSTDYVGVSGIEAAMESSLKGDNGEVGVKNGPPKKKATAGKNVQLTIDANLQYATENALNSEMKTLQSKGTVNGLNVSNATRGAAVAIDIHTGGILALASTPGYNPNDFSASQGLTEAQSSKYFNPDYEKMAKAQGKSQSLINYMFPIDTSIKGNTTIRKDKFDYYPKYLYNYATMSLIPSGSTFKPMTAIAGLQTGVINDKSTYRDQGKFDIGGGIIDHFITDGALGLVNVVSAIQKSSNPFFMNVGGLLRSKYGDDILAKYAWEFGLGSDPDSTKPGTGIEINENFGQVYNTVSQKNMAATEYLLSIEQDFNKGVSGIGTKFHKIDLYDREGDDRINYHGKNLLEIKTEIKDDIKDSVKNGTFVKSEYEESLKKLIAADPKYKKQKITATDLTVAVNDINFQAVKKGHTSLGLPYNMYIASIGQGMDNFTPLQMANYISTLANGGIRYKLHLVGSIKDTNGKLLSKTKPKVLGKANMSEKTRKIVMQGMNNVTGAGGNTDGTAAKALGKFPIPTGGKTGTAQFNTADIQNKVGRGDYGWYVGYAPANNPKVAISVVIFDGGYGSDVANVAKGMYESYFKNDPRMAKYKGDYDIKLKRMN
ncbi:cell division protein FtsI [Clostridium frigoris]|uniref:Cell division protein FtsI n=1 Tax=Clostridium frigoris TaxID=205327 RepID=A0ABS6BUV3_9CLOT|nr:penicillin-binding transpeptidase domain-containing protein [Clostridium frigoris]MBU3160699.1 cell division protein FtsI [Clostridium frigoris]